MCNSWDTVVCPWQGMCNSWDTVEWIWTRPSSIVYLFLVAATKFLTKRLTEGKGYFGSHVESVVHCGAGVWGAWQQSVRQPVMLLSQSGCCRSEPSPFFPVLDSRAWDGVAPFQVAFPASINVFSNTPYLCPEMCLLGGFKSYEADRVTTVLPAVTCRCSLP